MIKISQDISSPWYYVLRLNWELSLKFYSHATTQTKPLTVRTPLPAGLTSQNLGLAVQAFHNLFPGFLTPAPLSVASTLPKLNMSWIIRLDLLSLCLYLCPPSFPRCYLLPMLLNSINPSNITESNFLQAVSLDSFIPQWLPSLQRCYNIYWVEGGGVGIHIIQLSSSALFCKITFYVYLFHFCPLD